MARERHKPIGILGVNLENDNLTKFYEERYTEYLLGLERICRSRFLYTNVPQGINIRYLESILFRNGVATLFQDDVTGDYKSLQAIVRGSLNDYGEPYKFYGKGYNEYQIELNLDNAILVYNNDLMLGDYNSVHLYAHILANLDTTIQLNTIHLRKPYLMVGNKKQENTLKHIFKKILSFEPMIMVADNFDRESFDVIELNKSGNLGGQKDLYELKSFYFNEFLSSVGISNIAVQKKERMITDEVNQLMGGALAYRNSPLECRKRAVEQFNEMFNTNMEVEFNEQVRKGDPSFVEREEIIDGY